MRLRFGDDQDRAERSATWQRIAEARAHLGGRLPAERGLVVGDGAATARLEAVVDRAIRAIHPGLRTELHSLESGLHAVIAPISDEGLAPLVEEVAVRLGNLGAVRFSRHLPPLSESEAVRDVRARLSVDLHGARVRLGFSRGHLLEAVVYCPVFTSARDDGLLDAAELLVRRLVGDAHFDDWFGSVDVAPLPRGGPLRVVDDAQATRDAPLPLGEVLAATEVGIRGALGNLAEAPYHAFCERAEWTLFELEPDDAAEPTGFADAALFSTMIPEAMKCLLQGAPFSSCRFSRHGERFAYVKTDLRAASEAECLELRTRLEEALDWALVPGRFGCVVGAGIGLRHAYVVLALTDIERGAFIARQTLQRANVDTRSWILFCDTDLSNEWLGVWDSTPAPWAADDAKG